MGIGYLNTHRHTHIENVKAVVELENCLKLFWKV